MKLKSEHLVLYAVTDRSWLNGRTLKECVEEALKGGVTMIQLREKELSYEDFRCEAVEIQALCRKYGVPMLINDNVELAKEIDADGVHVGQSDMEAANARKILGADKIIGVTAKTPEQVRLAVEQGADYLGSGAVFGTTTKKDAKPMSMELLSEITAVSAVPVVAIGGITKENASGLKGTGIAGIAVVSGIFAEKDIRSAAEELKRITEQDILK